jgi:hypothetical protein
MPITLLHVLSVDRDGTEPAAGGRENRVVFSAEIASEYARRRDPLRIVIHDLEWEQK